METFQVVLAVSVPTLAVLIGILVSNSRLGDIRSELNSRLTELRSDMNTRSEELRSDMNARFGDVNSRLDDANRRLDDMGWLFDERLRRVEEKTHQREFPPVESVGQNSEPPQRILRFLGLGNEQILPPGGRLAARRMIR